MARYKVIVNTLNVRKTIPTDLPDKTTVFPTVSKGHILELEEVTNVPNPNLGKWYKDSVDQFYWGGGLQLLDTETTTFSPPTGYPWWLKNNLYAIPDLWKQKDQTKVTIAILDTGINKHIDFNFNNITGYNYLDNTPEYKTDVHGHGTHLAGIMVAQGKKSYGVAPNANLFVAKVCTDKGFPNINAVKKALEDIYTNKNNIQNSVIINMSFELIPNNQQEYDLKLEIENLINKLYNEKNTISICSSGDINDSSDTFPSLLNNCISVGALNKILTRHPDSRITDTLDIMAPGDNIESSYGEDKTVSLSGTSQAAAFISGVIALVLQKKSKSVFEVEIVKKKLLSTAISQSFLSKEYGHGIVNPNEFFNQLI